MVIIHDASRAILHIKSISATLYHVTLTMPPKAIMCRHSGREILRGIMAEMRNVKPNQMIITDKPQVAEGFFEYKVIF